MKDGEKLLEALMFLSEKYTINLFDAALKFCEIQNCDIESVLEMADNMVVELIKKDAITAGMVQKKHTRKAVNLDALMD